MFIDHHTILLRVVAALLCGALLGAEREYRGREAGIKSHAGLSVGCCLAILVSAFGFSDAVTSGLITLDPSRIAAGVEGGIGFACAAVIWRSRSKVIGLTTAINTWATANIGMACGAGMFFAAALITLAMLFIHIGLGALERWVFPRHGSCTITVKLRPGAENIVQQINAAIAATRATVLSMNLEQPGRGQESVVEVEVGRCSAAMSLQLLISLRALHGVVGVNCTGIAAD